jgi:phenylacetic acid degradation protein paaN
MSDFWTRHAAVMTRAIEAIGTRGYWSAYPETPSGKIYGETAKADADAAFEAMIGKPFALDAAHPATMQVGHEISPYGRDLSITYPSAPTEALVAASLAAAPGWAAASVEARAGVLLEILHRLNRQSFLVAQTVMHTSGQAFPMAFQAGGPHAQDRGLEAVAYAVAEMNRVPRSAAWEKPQGKAEPLRMEKSFRIVPRGVAVVIGCATFPTWNTYPGLFASLATGNTVIIKPHPAAILPVALTIRIGREVLTEAGFDPNVLMLAADEAANPVTRALVEHPAVRIVDFTGGPVFGSWIRQNLSGKQIYTEEAGVNAIVIDSAPSFRGMCDNIAFSLSLYSGQMCTAPQNIFVPKAGIATDEGHKSFDEVASGIAAATDRLLSDPQRAAAVLGAIQSDATLQRVAECARLGRVVRASAPVDGMAGARSATPLIIAVDAADEALYLEERFGPISFIIATASTADALARAASSIRERGAITAALYSSSDAVIAQAEDAFAAANVALSINLVGNIFVNQSAAFSDFHVTGGNPAGTACLTDTAFVANRFRVAPSRRLVA